MTYKGLFRRFLCSMNHYDQCPEPLRNFLIYHKAILGHSQKTVDEYFLDLRTFLRFLKLHKNLVPRTIEFDEITIDDISIDFLAGITLTDVYAFVSFLDTQRGLGAPAKARKISAIRSFYKYLTIKAKLLKDNPMQDLDSPKLKKTLPRYLDLNQSLQLLEHVSGANQERDYCILTLFLNCGLRISELIGLNIKDVQGDQLRVLGKGNKERIVFLNDACLQAISNWMNIRSNRGSADPNALFISSQSRKRISKPAVEKLVKKHLSAAGLDSAQFSPHKLRHTAATLMLQNGVDVRTLQEVLGHDNLNTTQIYTHVDNENLRVAAKANPLSQVISKPQTDKD